MKKNKRIIQAIVVIIVVGIGSIRNLDKHSLIYQRIHPTCESWENDPSDPDSAQVKETNLYIYTEKIIYSGLQHLIPHL
jgi:hypothetical protein